MSSPERNKKNKIKVKKKKKPEASYIGYLIHELEFQGFDFRFSGWDGRREKF